MLLQIVEPGASQERPIAVGIDLGTTNSAVAIVQDGKPVLIPTPTGDVLVPSLVAYDQDQVYVGKEAMQKPHFLSSVKRRMGTGKSESVKASAALLKSLKQQAEFFLKKPITQAVITVPSYFSESARSATRLAAQAAGLHVLRLINEPTAAALAYGLDHCAQGIFAVYDLGGGTFDISILRLHEGVFQVLATGGDTHLGGDDMDEIIAEKGNISLLAARRIKEKLTINLTCEEEGFRLTQNELTLLLQPLIKKTVLLMKDALDQAHSPAIDGVILVGGATRIPAIQDVVEKFFGQKPLTNLDPDGVVAMGAAIQAHALTHGADSLLLDVTSLSFGVETMGGIVERVIHRNSPLPTSASQFFTTYQEGQDGMSIHVVQGEHEDVNKCRSLGLFTLKGIPSLPAGIPRIEVIYMIDADGLLTVSAQEKTTGVFQSIEIQPSHGLTDEEVHKLLTE